MITAASSTLAPYLYGVGVALLLLVLTPLGKVVNGNRSWLDLGSFSFQPSEMAKIFTLMFLAYYLAGVRKRPLDLQTVVVAVGIWALPTALVFLENDTGSALSFTSFLAAMLFLAGVRWSWVAAALGAVVIAMVVVAPHIKNCESYKCERVKSVYWPDLAKKRYRYQNEQAEIAVGSGAILGKGPRGSTQGALGFLPEVHNDFIFAVASEEWGFIGSSLSLAIYLMIIARLIQIARRSRERAGHAAGRGFSGSAALSRDGQCGDGHSTLADYGNPAASDELRLDVGRGHMFRPRTGDQRASATLCELSRSSPQDVFEKSCRQVAQLFLALSERASKQLRHNSRYFQDAVSTPLAKQVSRDNKFNAAVGSAPMSSAPRGVAGDVAASAHDAKV